MQTKYTFLLVVVTIGTTLGVSRLWDYWRSGDPATDIHAETDYEEHASHEEDEKVFAAVNLDPQELQEFGIAIDTAGPGVLKIHRDLPGEITIDPDRLAHIVPRFPGLVKEVRKRLGDQVQKGEVLAIIESNESLAPYEVRSLIDGTVIEMHLTQGEMISDADHAFVVADLSEVWANLSIYQKDLPYIRIGQLVEIDVGPDLPKPRGTISYISPILDGHTRTATARVILDNTEGRLRPGLFITGKVVVDTLQVKVSVPKTAVHVIDGQESVFVRTDEGFAAHPVYLGRSNERNVEIVSGLTPGQVYVARGGFTLKAQLAKGSFAGGHAH
jgi:cobalt-zinc-cadmium efflux system membrane fusion protein